MFSESVRINSEARNDIFYHQQNSNLTLAKRNERKGRKKVVPQIERRRISRRRRRSFSTGVGYATGDICSDQHCSTCCFARQMAVCVKQLAPAREQLILQQGTVVADVTGAWTLTTVTSQTKLEDRCTRGFIEPSDSTIQDAT